IVAVGDGAAVKLGPQYQDMAMGMVAVMMPEYKIGVVVKAHLLHIFPSHRQHLFVGHAFSLCKVEAGVVGVLFEPGIQGGNQIHFLFYDRFLQADKVGGQQLCPFLFVGTVHLLHVVA
ncbi:MAG TPA: hypothetical protein VKZ98_00215, partial [Aquaticitalea sp.]|nr:hypothetical protein [Aquaticitalea sp.]